jgi:hypothetical protein
MAKTQQRLEEMKQTILAEDVVNEQVAIIARLLDDGFIDVYTGTQPDQPEDPVTTQTLLVSNRLSGFSSPKNGIIFALPITDAIAIATGDAAWARCFAADHRTAVIDISVGAKDANVTVTSTRIERGSVVEILEWEHCVPRTTPGV